MHEIFLNQLKASLSTLNQNIIHCPDSEWDESHGDAPFSQVIFHTLFYTDVYLGRDETPLKDQNFHKENKDFFKDYEELEDKIPENLYDKKICTQYLQFCLKKSELVLNNETIDSLNGESGISYRKICRAELYIYLIRHIQHHAAQLGLQIQNITGKELSWVGSGWK